jgi:hypothetical protein
MIRTFSSSAVMAWSGGQIAAELGPNYAGRVVVAGPSRARADEAAAIGHGARGRSIDIAMPSPSRQRCNGVRSGCRREPQPTRNKPRRQGS